MYKGDKDNSERRLQKNCTFLDSMLLMFCKITIALSIFNEDKSSTWRVTRESKTVSIDTKNRANENMNLFLQPVPASCAARKHGRAHPSELSSDQCPDLCCGSRPYAEAFLFPSCSPCWAFAGQKRTRGKDGVISSGAFHRKERWTKPFLYTAPTLLHFAHPPSMNLHFGLVFEKMVQQFNDMAMYGAATLQQITCRVVNGRRATATPRKTKVSTHVQRDRRIQLLKNGYVSGILYPQLVCNIVGDLGLHSLR